MNSLTETEDLLKRINDIRSDYANENRKGVFSSKQYKNDCAATVLKSIDIDRLLKSTLVCLSDSYHIYFDYTIFKTFAVPELNDRIIQYAIQLINSCINKYGLYEMHVNMNSFSISAFYRYNEILQKYSYECNTNCRHFHEKIKIMHLYNIPSTIETISQLIGPMMPEMVRVKMKRYDKNASEKAIMTISQIVVNVQSSNNLVSDENT